MSKIAMIGAGSQVFCKTLVSDILATPALRDSDILSDEPDAAETRPDGSVRETHDPPRTVCPHKWLPRLTAAKRSANAEVCDRG